MPSACCLRAAHVVLGMFVLVDASAVARKRRLFKCVVRQLRAECRTIKKCQV